MNFLFFAFNLPRLNLHAQIALVLLLSIGVLLARVKRFRLHAILQSAVVLLNLGYILRIMLPSLRHQLPASYRMSRKDLPVAIVLLHSFLGAGVAYGPLCHSGCRHAAYSAPILLLELSSLDVDRIRAVAGRIPAGMPCVLPVVCESVRSREA
jgi:hypothetical protein